MIVLFKKIQLSYDCPQSSRFILYVPRWPGWTAGFVGRTRRESPGCFLGDLSVWGNAASQTGAAGVGAHAFASERLDRGQVLHGDSVALRSPAGDGAHAQAPSSQESGDESALGFRRGSKKMQERPRF